MTNGLVRMSHSIYKVFTLMMSGGNSNVFSSKDIKTLMILLLDIFLLSIGHALNSQVIILVALVVFSGAILMVPKSYFLPIMLFYFPWSPIMKLSPNSFTWFTIIVPLFFICILIFKKEEEPKVRFSSMNLIISLGILLYTLGVKMWLGYSISNSYIMFVFMLIFIPTYLKTYKEKISFENCSLFLAIGVISACIASEILTKYPHMLKYIEVYEWKAKGLIRLSGFYGDPNFYSVHILIAICGLLILLIDKRYKRPILLGSMIIVLIYFGFLSVSKMFILVLLVELGLWIMMVLLLKGRTKTKISIVFYIVIALVIILSSGILSEQIHMYLVRFGAGNNLKSLTTGRNNLILIYIDFFMKNIPALVFGQGLTSILIGNLPMVPHNTIVQMIYEFGCVGSIGVVLWIINLYKDTIKGKKNHYSLMRLCYMVLFITGCFLPWMSLDMLFFDEFFYIIALFVIGKNYVMEIN